MALTIGEGIDFLLRRDDDEKSGVRVVDLIFTNDSSFDKFVISFGVFYIGI